MKHNSTFTCLLLMIVLLSCIEPYEFSAIDFERKLVVDATLTNETKEHLVHLSYTFPLDTSLDVAVTGAVVNFIEPSGNRVALREKSAGHYYTDPDYSGVPGQSYQLSIVLADGEEYLSNSELLRDPVPIDSVYARYTSIPVMNELGEDLTGVQLFVDSHSDAAERHSFRYDYEESYQVPVPFPSQLDFHGTGDDFEVFPREQPLGTCYRTGHPTTQLLATTRGLSENRIFEYRVRFISEFSQLLAYDYIISVKQHSVSNEAYAFYKELRTSNESNGSLSDKQLGTVPSNVINVNNPLNFALGYFEVAGVSEYRKRLSYRDFLKEGIQTEEWICMPHPLIPDPGGLDRFNSNCYTLEEMEFKVLFVTDTFQVSKAGDTTFFTLREYRWGEVDDLLNNYPCSPNLRITRMSPAQDKAYLALYLCSDCTTYGSLERPAIWD